MQNEFSMLKKKKVGVGGFFSSSQELLHRRNKLGRSALTASVAEPACARRRCDCNATVILSNMLLVFSCEFWWSDWSENSFHWVLELKLCGVNVRVNCKPRDIASYISLSLSRSDNSTWLVQLLFSLISVCLSASVCLSLSLSRFKTSDCKRSDFNVLKL